jgi:GMP synthase (glutamine-hydrolysing)
MGRFHEKILVLDFGSQYTQLIARRVREAHVYSEILPYNAPVARILGERPCGLILSGGPASVYDRKAPAIRVELLQAGIPVLGICYGMQLVTHLLGGKVARATHREFGPAELQIDERDDLFKGIEPAHRGPTVWMSHGDRIEEMPAGFIPIARTSNSPVAAMKSIDPGRPVYCLQFHPEVAHTEGGATILKNFVRNVCGCKADWSMRSFMAESMEAIRAQVGTGKLLCALSGGVDSSVAALLAHEAVGDRLTCLFVDNGLLRKGEKDLVRETFAKHFKIKLRVISAANRFVSALAGISDPERKRRIVGRLFIREFENFTQRGGKTDWLVQGTLYPDVIESVSFKGPSATIKTHHNVGGLPSRMRFKLIEPLRELFKDEVRVLGKELGLPDEIVWRQPFPGPGLAIRILGPVTTQRLTLLREADAIVQEEIQKAGLYTKIWQAFAVLLPIRTVGVMGDQRTYDNVMAVRAVTSLDGMTADWARLPNELLATISTRLINEVKGVNRVVYDVSSKPPSTIEWE